MKAQRIVEHRDQSVPATCQRWLPLAQPILGYPGWHHLCGAQMQLLVTRSPLRELPYEELVVRRCLMGHLETSDGVLDA